MTRTNKAALLALCMASVAAAADRSDAFPLRVQILHARAHSPAAMCPLSDGNTRGAGYGNLFQNGEARGFRYAYACAGRMHSNGSMQTYAAPWKKSEAKLTVLIPMEGKPDKFWTCDLDIEMKNFAFAAGNATISTSAMKEWMKRHDFNPERSKPASGNTIANDQSHE